MRKEMLELEDKFFVASKNVFRVLKIYIKNDGT